ncbi:toxin TcdB middle/N-terminal domain-containing protein [Agrobacterium radiobacter]|uniref:Toxin TcdB middle/N-terminal domain-containing protein n=1 Tax=Agrobacterium radiobacter TaxID=362 RepID=A0ABD5LPL1_AGRRD
MQNNRSGFAALAAIVLLCALTGGPRDLMLTAFGWSSIVAAAEPADDGFGNGRGLGNATSDSAPLANPAGTVAPVTGAKNIQQGQTNRLDSDGGSAVDRANGVVNGRARFNSSTSSQGTTEAGTRADSSDQQRDGKQVEAQAFATSDLEPPDPTDPVYRTPATGSALASYKSRSPESLGSGAFFETVKLVVPGFRGAEPDLSLKYSSNGGLGAGGWRAGWIGVGWSLEGVPDIVRSAPINGTPRFDANDVYQLEGQDMITCAAGINSPSCAAGGTHTTRVENYQRIKFENNIWTVTSKDGVQSIFKALSVWGTTVEVGEDNPALLRDNYRWLLAQRIDANGNVVDYSYTCLTLPVCYPNMITYNGAEIRFVSATHPAYQTKASGRNLSRLEWQLKRIEVRFAGQQVRAYTLAHETSPSTNLQRLKQVQEFGRDWTVGSDGAVTGNSLPPTKFSYSDSEVNYVKGSQNFTGGVEIIGDYNGDGRQDLLTWQSPNGNLTQCAISINISIPSNAFQLVQATFASGNNIIACPGDWENVGDRTILPQYGFMGGDFNGDGYADFATALGYGLAIYINQFPVTGSYSFVQTYISDVYANPRTNYVQDVAMVDFDGDGATDVYSAKNRAVYKFQGGSWVAVSVNGPGAGRDNNFSPSTSSNGSGILFNTSLNGGSSGYEMGFDNSFNHLYNFVPTAHPTYGSPNSLISMDLNGDGVSDGVGFEGRFTETSNVPVDPTQNTLPYGVQIGMSKGSTFMSSEAIIAHPWCPALHLPPVPDSEVRKCTVTAAEINGDGRAEILVKSQPVGFFEWETAEALPVTVFDRGGGVWGQNALPRIPIAYAVDLNGDGKSDFIRDASPIVWQWISTTGEVWYSTGATPDLLTSVTLPGGGLVQIEYKPSSEWGLTAGTRMPFVMQTVTAIVESDGRGGVARTEYSYRGGRYDYKERKFLGFAGLTAKLPCVSGELACPTIDVTFSQSYAASGKPLRVEYRGGAGDVRKTVAHTYEIENTTLPYRALNTRTDTTLTEGVSSLTLRQDRSFDAYGNITDIRDYGRTDVSGDETWTGIVYPYNTTAYIVSLPRLKWVRSGGFDATTAVLEHQEAFFYDWAASDLTPPAKGNLTMKQSYKTAVPSSNYYSYELYTYDVYGNRLSHFDGAGNKTAWSYDATYNLFVTAEFAPAYHANGSLPADTRFVTTFTPNLVCGKPASETDWNGVTETYTYDVFCRSYGQTNSGTGKYVNTRYENEGNPAAQAIVTYEPLATGSGSVFTRTFYDGLGRPWRVQTSGETESGEPRITDTVYDARGNVAQVASPRFANEAVQWTVNSYDALNRVVKSANPDASQRTYGYFVYTATSLPGSSNLPVLETRVTDEEGKLHRTITDKNDNVIVSSGQTSGSWINEYRTYDVLGRLKRIQDPGGAVWTYTYDLMGNRLTASDPDLGNWSYTYDNANRLISQTDARGAVTTLAYDQMGRLKTKSVKAAGETTATVTATNTYDTVETGVGVSPFHNVGLLTKSVNGSATHSMSRSLTGSGSVLTTKTTIDAIAHTSVETKGATDQTLSITYTPAALTVGTAAAPWTYNVANKLSMLPGYITAATYEADGQTKTITYANGVTTEFIYSTTRRWLTRVTTRKGATVLMDSQYDRDGLGRIKTITGLTPSENWTYAYDDLGRLVTATNAGDGALSETYTYSLSGNLLSRTKIAGAYVYPAGGAVRPHAPVTIGARTLAYDSNGNMTSDGTRTLTWDRSNLLQSVAEGSSTTTFAYGPDGARAMKTAPLGKTLYTNADVEIDRTTAGSEVYTRYPHPDVKLVTTAANVTTKYWLHRDHLSSVRLVTGDTGTVVEQTGYAAYGEQTNQVMATKKSYIGERYDAETGLMYLNARYYDPTFGRYVPKDDHAADIGAPEDGYSPATPWQVRPGSVSSSRLMTLH